jgi:hypothetical protein
MHTSSTRDNTLKGGARYGWKKIVGDDAGAGHGGPSGLQRVGLRLGFGLRHRLGFRFGYRNGKRQYWQRLRKRFRLGIGLGQRSGLRNGPLVTSIEARLKIAASNEAGGDRSQKRPRLRPLFISMKRRLGAAQ